MNKVRLASTKMVRRLKGKCRIPLFSFCFCVVGVMLFFFCLCQIYSNLRLLTPFSHVRLLSYFKLFSSTCGSHPPTPATCPHASYSSFPSVHWPSPAGHTSPHSPRGPYSSCLLCMPARVVAPSVLPRQGCRTPHSATSRSLASPHGKCCYSSL